MKPACIAFIAIAVTGCLPHSVARRLVEGPKQEAKDQLGDLVAQWDSEMQGRIHAIAVRIAHQIAVEAKAVNGDLDAAVAEASDALADDIAASVKQVANNSDNAFVKLVADVRAAAIQKLHEVAARRSDSDASLWSARLDTEREIRMSSARSDAATWAAGELKIASVAAMGLQQQCKAAVEQQSDCELQYRTTLQASKQTVDIEMQQRLESAKLDIEAAVAKERQEKSAQMQAEADAWYATEEAALLQRLQHTTEVSQDRVSQLLREESDVGSLRSTFRKRLDGVVARKADGVVSEEAIASKIEDRLHTFVRGLERHAQSELENLLDKAADELVADLSKHW